jgi:GT2 family glycosyltransferase
VLSYDAPFNYSAINNMAVKYASGELICLLNNDIEPISNGWLRELVSHALRPGIGAVGAMLYYPDDTIQHAGVVLNGVAAGHLHVGLPRGSAGYANRAQLVQNLSAVTAACLLVRKKIWNDIGGMDEINLPVAFNDVDFCLKVQQHGYRNLWTPFAELYHHESASRGRDDTPEKRARFHGEINFLQGKWGDLLRNDPAWNPNLALDSTWPRRAHPPRGIKPWRHFGEGH